MSDEQQLFDDEQAEQEVNAKIASLLDKFEEIRENQITEDIQVRKFLEEE